MISSSMPLHQFVAKYEQENECLLGVFPTVKKDRFAIRIVDEDNPNKGLTFVAAFSSKISDADMPDSPADRKSAAKALFHRIHDKKGRLSMCTCVIDEDSIEQFPDKYTEKDIDTSFMLVTNEGSVEGVGVDFQEEAKTLVVYAD